MFSNAHHSSRWYPLFCEPYYNTLTPQQQQHSPHIQMFSLLYNYSHSNTHIRNKSLFFYLFSQRTTRKQPGAPKQQHKTTWTSIIYGMKRAQASPSSSPPLIYLLNLPSQLRPPPVPAPVVKAAPASKPSYSAVTVAQLLFWVGSMPTRRINANTDYSRTGLQTTGNCRYR